MFVQIVFDVIIILIYCPKVITVDARNHGDSPHTAEQSYPLMAEDVKFLMKDLGVKKASLIGHSMGGRTMMYLAVVYVRFVLIMLFQLFSLLASKINSE